MERSKAEGELIEEAKIGTTDPHKARIKTATSTARPHAIVASAATRVVCWD